MKKNNKFKIFTKKFKELWSIPRYRAIIKLSLYGLMFLLLIIMANIYNETSTNTEADNQKSFAQILNSTNFQNTDIKYKINNYNIIYYIEGTIENNILTGYLENNGNIKKIKIENNSIYNLVNNNEIIDTELNNSLLLNFLIPQNIINLISKESSYIEKTNDKKMYTYNINYNNINYEVKITTNLENVTNINIKNNNIDYSLDIL